MVTAKLTKVVQEIPAIAAPLYYIIAGLLLAAGFSSFGKAVVSWLLNRLYDLVLGI